MTISQILTSARNNLNAVNDNLWSDSELLVKLYEAILQLARKTYCIEETDSTGTSTASTADYTMPTKALAVIRVDFDGKKLQYITQREKDQLFFNVSPAPTGTPIYYSVFGRTVTLSPTPNTSSLTIKYSMYTFPTSVPAASDTLTVPVEFHDSLVSGLTYRMVPKDLGNPLTLFWRDKWANDLDEVEKIIKKRRRADRFLVVQTEENSITTNFGAT